jgi:methionyl-tRNA formyltransferase
LRFVYLGSSEFAATVLRALAGSEHSAALAVTPPDRRSGRGRSMHPPPAAVAAAELGIELHQTADVNSEEPRRAVLATGCEVAVVCAFGQLIKEQLLAELPMLNLHPSLLPRWRGAAPIERAIMAGDERTGVCVMRLTTGLDSGPVALTAERAIGPGDDYGGLASALADQGGLLMTEALRRLEDGTLDFRDQPDRGATYAAKIEPGDRQVDPAGSAASESRRVRALTPHVGAFVMLAGDARLGIREVTAVADGPEPARFDADPSREALLLGLDDGALSIAAVQPAGKRWMSAAEYMRGHGVPAGAERPGR